MNELDRKIKELDYNSKDILIYDGESITKFIPKEGKFENDRFIVTTKTKRTIGDDFFDISVVTSTLDRIYLGAILLANEKLMQNIPIEVSCRKKEINFRVNNLLGLSSEEANAKIENPTASSVMGKIQDIAQIWLDKYSEKNKNTTILDYKESMIFSEAQLMTEFGLEAKGLGNKLNIDFQNKKNKQVYLCRLKQIYYSATMDAPSIPSNFILDTWSELSAKGVSSKNPPVYVSNIDFGRVIYIKFETEDSSLNVKNAFSAIIKGINIENNNEYKEIIKNSTFSLLVIGGAIEEIEGNGLDSVENIRKIINKGLSFSKNSPGFPISYTTTFLKNNEIAVTKAKTDYIEMRNEIFTNGEITLVHNGAYVARFFIKWEEFTYDINGKELIKVVEWENNGKQRTVGYRETIPLKANTKNISVIAEGATGLIWEPWRKSINKNNIPLIKSRVFSISGTTLNQIGDIEPKI